MAKKKYTIKKGDTFSEIAKRNGITTEELKRLNPEIQDISKVNIGQEINIGGENKKSDNSKEKEDSGRLYKFSDTGHVGENYAGNHYPVNTGSAVSRGVVADGDPDRWYRMVNPSIGTDLFNAIIAAPGVWARYFSGERKDYDRATEHEEKMWKAYLTGDISELPESPYRFDSDDEKAQYVGLPREQTIIIQSLLDRDLMSAYADKLEENTDKEYAEKYREAALGLIDSVYNNPGSWVLVNEHISPIREYVLDENGDELYYTTGLGALKNFSIRWDDKNNYIDVKDDYDFNGKKLVEGIIPQRDVPLRIRERIKFYPEKGSLYRRDSTILDNKRFKPVYEGGGQWIDYDDHDYHKSGVYTMPHIDRIIGYLKGTGEGMAPNRGYVSPGGSSNKARKDKGVRENQDYIYNRLVNEHGFAPIQAVAILANLTHESGLTDDILGDNGASYGLQQWQGQRRKNLFSFAKSKGRSKPTVDDQIDFLVHEYKNNQAFQFKDKGQNLYQAGKTDKDMFDYFQYSKADFDNAESLWDATIAWNQGAGRPNKKYAFNNRRYEIAVHLANRYGVDYGKERKYTDMGYSDMVQQEPVNTGDKNQDYYENYGKQILVNVLPAQTPGTVQSVSFSETNVEKELDEDEEYNAEQIEAIRQEQEMEKRRSLIAAFLPNIQLKIKGTSKASN